MTLRKYWHAILPTLSADLSADTLRNYGLAVKRLQHWLGRDIDLEDISPQLIERFRTVDKNSAGAIRILMATQDPVRFRQRRHMPEKPAKQRCSDAHFYLGNLYEQRYEPLALRSRWRHRKRLLEAWPDVELENAPRRQPLAWTEAEIQQLYRTMTRLDGQVGMIRACHWWTALLLVAWDSGERIGAILRLQWPSVDLGSGWVRFVAEDRKGGREDSCVRLSADAVEALRKLLATGGPVFPWPYSSSTLWLRFTAILRTAGLPHDAKRKFHCIRKTVASYAEARGGNATAMLRHSKRAVTEAYLDPRVVTRQQPADVLFRLTNSPLAADQNA